MCDFDKLNGVFEDGGEGEIGWRYDVRDIAVYEDIAGVEPKDRGFWDSGI